MKHFLMFTFMTILVFMTAQGHAQEGAVAGLKVAVVDVAGFDD